MWRIIILLGVIIAAIHGQSNYDDQANSIEYSGSGLPESTVLDGKVTKLDDLLPIIFLNRTKAALNCAAGYMQIELKFEEPFWGIVYADFDRSSTCSSFGTGNRTARIDLPLKGCGTRQDPQRVFTNNIVVRFHPSLEMDGDEVITIVCRYPPPIAPPPPALPGPLQVPGPVPITESPLKGFQILLIICGILFLSLVLLGLAASYYCLKNQRIRVVRRHAVPAAASEKGSESSLGDISIFDGVKIPRVNAPIPPSGSSSGSEAALMSDTLPSDYPSESPSTAHSEAEDMDGRSLRRSGSSVGSYDNRGYIHESTMYEQYGQHTEMQMSRHVRPPPPEPKFDVHMRVKRAPAPSPTSTLSSSDTEGSIINQERNLSTIHEWDETMEMTERPQTFTYRPEIHSPPKSQTPPIYSEVVRRPQVTSWETEAVTQQEIIDTDVTESYERRMAPHTMEKHTSELTTEILEPPVVPSRRPEITSHVVDDVFLRTITEKKTIEDIERHRRQVTEYQAKPLPLPSKWDVTIRNYPNPDAPPRNGDDTSSEWESISESSSVTGIPAYEESHKRVDMRYESTLDIPVPNPLPQNWSSLLRVLEHDDGSEVFKSEQELTIEDKRKWRKIITTESTLRTLLTEATVREDYERIRKDYERLYEPAKWEVIIRILSPDRLYDQRGQGGSNRYRKRTDWETRSRRSSLPTLYEYDSDGSSIRNLNIESTAPGGFDPLGRSRRTSRSSFKSDIDVRSMTETTVDFARQEDNTSEVSSYYPPKRYYDDYDKDASDYDDTSSLVRSVSQPSLARSASEFTENWGIRGRSWDPDSPDQSPRSSVRSKGNQKSSYSMKQSSYQQQSRWFSEHDGTT